RLADHRPGRELGARRRADQGHDVADSEAANHVPILSLSARAIIAGSLRACTREFAARIRGQGQRCGTDPLAMPSVVALPTIPTRTLPTSARCPTWARRR